MRLNLGGSSVVGTAQLSADGRTLTGSYWDPSNPNMPELAVQAESPGFSSLIGSIATPMTARDPQYITSPRQDGGWNFSITGKMLDAVVLSHPPPFDIAVFSPTHYDLYPHVVIASVGDAQKQATAASAVLASGAAPVTLEYMAPTAVPQAQAVLASVAPPGTPIPEPSYTPPTVPTTTPSPTVDAPSPTPVPMSVPSDAPVTVHQDESGASVVTKVPSKAAMMVGLAALGAAAYFLLKK